MAFWHRKMETDMQIREEEQQQQVDVNYRPELCKITFNPGLRYGTFCFQHPDGCASVRDRDGRGQGQGQGQGPGATFH